MRISLTEACQLLKAGEVVALPTETVYGLAASLSNPPAITQIFQLKGRPANNPLIIHLANTEQAYHYSSEFPPQFKELAEAFWPGPLTLVVSVNPALIPSQARSNLLTAGFRIPSHPITLDILHQVGPLVMPSANLSGKPSGTQSAHIESDFGKHFPVVDGGCCERGLESTILTYRQDRWEIIRLGALPAEAFLTVLGYMPEFAKQSVNEAPLCPGQLYRHYAPQAKLILCKDFPSDYQGTVIGFNERIYSANCKKMSLGSLSAPAQVAENLYAILRELDQNNISEAYVDLDFPESGLWVTIAERLNRAAKKEHQIENKGA